MTTQGGLCIRPGDQTEIRAIDIQNRIGRFRMAEDISRIDPEFQTRRFAEFYGFHQIRIKAPSSRDLHRTLAESAALSGRRILEQNLDRLRIECQRQSTAEGV